MQVRGVIFDFDGTLLDSVDLRVTAWKKAFQSFGVEVPEDMIRPMIGYPGVDLAKKFVNNPLDVEMLQEDYFLRNIESAKFFQDVIPTLSKLKARGIKTAVVTSTRRMVIQKFSIPVDHVVTIDDVSHGKPDSEPYEKALKMMGISAEECIVVGDIENDLIPAKKIRCTAVLVKHGRKISSSYADYEIENIAEILDIIDHLSGKNSR
ncbi:HAD family hydrolase [Thermoplasma sp.]|uniref:HAD family hydrolase n=1 Tax=Thermoplasma sp. TaxID=1973142 RepID=UPI0025E13E38|nr:HAD family phosphatase [Thermoplasma sp.]